MFVFHLIFSVRVSHTQILQKGFKTYKHLDDPRSVATFFEAAAQLVVIVSHLLFPKAGWQKRRVVHNK